MNQNQQNVSRIRQMSSKEAAKAQGISVAELQKTQVLNLKAVEDAVRFEKLTSKKPAIVLGIVGIMFILFGTTFQIVDTVQSRPKNVIEKRTTVVDEVDKTQKLQCQQKSQFDGITKEFTIFYEFEDNQLIGFTKTLQLVSANSTVIQNYINSFQTYVNPSEGYNPKIERIESGMKFVVEVDYDTLDLTKLNPKQQAHYASKIDYALDTSYNRIKTDMVNGSYVCQ